MGISDTNVKEFYNVILKLKTQEDCALFFEDLCTYKELEQMVQRIEAAKLLLQNKTYEEINKDHINLFGGLDYLIFICEDKTLDVGRTEGEYIKIVDEKGNKIKAKYIFDTNNSYEYKIIDENDNYYSLNFNWNGVAYYESKKVSNIHYDANKYVVKITFTYGESEQYENVYSVYDAQNNKDM